MFPFGTIVSVNVGVVKVNKSVRRGFTVGRIDGSGDPDPFAFLCAARKRRLAAHIIRYVTRTAPATILVLNGVCTEFR